MDRLIREWQRFLQALRSFAAFVVVVLSFACISFLFVLRDWFPVTRTSSPEILSRKDDNTQYSTSNEEISRSKEPQVTPRTLNWQRIRQCLESYAVFAALSSTVAFICSIFTISDAVNSIRSACNAAFQQNSASSTPRNGSSLKFEGPTSKNAYLQRLQGPMPRDARLAQSEDPTSRNESLPRLERPTQRNESSPLMQGSTPKYDSMPDFESPTPRIESCPELEGLALRIRESGAGIQMIPSGNPRKSLPSKGHFKNISHIRELQKSNNSSSPQKRKGDKSDIEDRIRSESISNHEADQKKSTGDGRKKFRSTKKVTIDSFTRRLTSVECGSNLNEYSIVETSQENNPQRSEPINVRDSCQRKSGEESCQERSLGQRSPAVFHKVNEGAGPSRQPEAVLYHENSRKQNKSKTPKNFLNVPVKRQDLSDSPSTHTSSISSNIPPSGSCETIIEAGSSHLFSDDIGQQQIEQSTEEKQHELALLRESLTSIPWSYIFPRPSKPSQDRSNHQSPRTPGFLFACSKTQIPSLPNQQESIRARGSPYQFSRTLAGIQMIPSGNLRKSISFKGNFKNVSHIRELQQSDNRSSPQKRKGDKSDIEDKILSESISNNEVELRISKGEGRKKFRSTKKVTIDSSAKGLTSVECGSNSNEYSTAETSQENNPQRSAPINASDSCQRKLGEESCQDTSLGQRSPAVFHRVNEGAGPSRQPDSVLYHGNYRNQNTSKIPKEFLGVPIKIQGSSDSITHTSSSSSNILPGGSYGTIIEAGSSQFFSDDIGQQQVEQSTEEEQHEIALFRESLTSIPWSYIFPRPCKPSQDRSNHHTPRTPDFLFASSKTQIPSLLSQQESIRTRDSPYPFSKTNLHSNQRKISAEGSLDESEHQQESSHAVSGPREPLTLHKTSLGGSRNESLRTQDSSKSPEASTDSCLDKESQHVNNVPRPSSQFLGMDISQQVIHEVTDGSQWENSQPQGSLAENTGGHISKPRETSPGTSQPESMMIRSSSYAHKSPNKGSCELTTKDSTDAQNVEVSQVNTDRNTKDKSTENSKDGQHSVADKSVEEGTKNKEILHSAEISRVEDTITKKTENIIESPKESVITVNVMFPDERKEKGKVAIDHRGETNTSDKILKKGREVSPPEIEVKGAFLTEKSTESLDQSFGEPDLAERRNMTEISHDTLPISSCPPQTTMHGTLQETLVLEETTTITKDNDNTMFPGTSYCKSSEKRDEVSLSEDDNAIAKDITLDCRPPERMSKTDD